MKRKWVSLSGLAVMVAIMQVHGCAAIIPPITFPFNLGTAGAFKVELGVAKQNVLAVDNFDTQGFSVVSGTMTIDPSTITITPDAEQTAKGTVSLQARTFTIEVQLGGPGTEETVCTDGELFGPFTVEIDENFNVLSITPSSVSFSENAVSLLNGGVFVLCIRTEADFSGTIDIDQFVFTVRVG